MRELRCYLCPQGYLHSLRDNVLEELRNYFNVKLAIYDIDAIVEVGNRVRAIFEWKMKKQHYGEYYLQSFEYVALKKLGKSLKTTPFLINQILPDDAELIVEASSNPEKALYQNSEFVVFEIDRFERKGEREFRKVHGVNYVIYPEEEGQVMSWKEFRSWIGRMILDRQVVTSATR
ncbi:hypothetical protein [Geoglobus ahangari]